MCCYDRLFNFVDLVGGLVGWRCGRDPAGLLLPG